MALPRPRDSRPVVTAVAALLLAVHAWLGLSATIGAGITADETAHLTAGYSYWRNNDYRLQPENGNLPQRWAALLLVATSPEPRLDPSDAPDAWARSHVWLISQHFLYHSGNNTEFLLFCARAMATAWSVAAGLLVFSWSRRLWGDVGGLFSLALFALSPTTLAHGPLVTSDMCAAFCLLAATGAWWRALERPTTGRLLLSFLAFAAAAVAKFSFVLIIPILVLTAAWRAWSQEPLTAPGRRPIETPWGRFTFFAGLGIAHAVVAWAVIWACFGFRYSAFAPDLPAAQKFFVAWPQVLPDGGVWRVFFDVTREHHLLPEAYLQGFAYVLRAAQERGAFAAGQFSTTGWWWFFPYAFAVKSSLAELIAAAGVVGLIGRVMVRAGRDARVRLTSVAPLLIFGLVIGGAALTSSLNIGQRHILPLYLVLFIAAGSLAQSTLGQRGRIVAVLLAGLTAIESFAVRPDYLTFFNAVAGGPQNGWRHLVDSSLDWGQNLPKLATWLARNRKPGEEVYLTQFGLDDPTYHGIEAHELAPYVSYGRPRQWLELQPGLYCVSATMLQDVYSPYAGAWTPEREANYRKLLTLMRAELASGRRSPALGEFGEGPEKPLWNADRARFARLALYLRHRTPDAVVGGSIHVFRLNPTEVRTVVDGSFVELATLIAEREAARAQGN